MTESTQDPAPTPDPRVAELESRLAGLEADLRARLVHAELKAEAVRAGMIDLDGLKLVDSTNLKLADNGEIEGAAALMGKFKQDKPWLFTPPNSSSTATPPPATPPKPKLATEMTHEEWQAARADLLRRA